MNSLRQHQVRMQQLADDAKTDKSRLAVFLQWKEAEAAKQHRWMMNNRCPRCNMVLTSRLTCPMDC